MFRLLPALLLALVPLPSLAADATATIASPEAVIKLIPRRNRWVMEAEVGGTPRRFILDTAGGVTLVSPTVAKAANCELYGRVTGFTMLADRGDGPRCSGKPFKAGGVTMTPPSLGVIDIGKLNPADADLDGLVALNLFEGRTITIDFAAGILTIESPASREQRVAKMRALPIRMSREVSGLALSVFAQVPTAKGALLMELDSGNGGTVLVSKPVAALVGLDPLAEGKQRADFAVLGDIRATTDDAFTPDMIIEGNLGMPFLRNWVLTLDLAAGKAWIGKPPVPPKPAVALPPKA